MDIVWQTKSMELMVKLLWQDHKGIYAAPYLLNSLGEGESTPLPRETPEAHGIPSAALREFLEIMGAAPDQNVHSAMVLRGGAVVCEAAWQPYALDMPQMLYSMSKSILSTAVGIAVDEGRLGLDEHIVDIFGKRCRLPRHTQKLKPITVRHLLTMSTGIAFNEMGSALAQDWVQAFMEAEVKFPAGTDFDYNSLNTYMLAAVLRERTGESVMEYLKPRLFEPLGIRSGSWEACPKGVEKGGWGLSLRLEDAAKIGQLYLQKGSWEVGGEARQIVSGQWVEEATHMQIPTPHGEMTDGYGYQIWMASRPGSYVFNGVFGQFVVVVPDQDMVIAIFSGSPLLFARGATMEAVETLIAAISPPDTCLRRATKEAKALDDRITSLRFAWDDPGEADSLRAAGELLDGRAFSFLENAAGVMPLILQGVHTNFSQGVNTLRFNLTPGALEVEFCEGAACNTAFVPLDGGAARQMLRFGSEEHAAAVRGTAQIKNRESVELKLYFYFLHTPDVRVITLNISGGLALAVFDEIPSVQAAMGMLMELTGEKKRKYLRHGLERYTQEELRTRMRQMAVPMVVGTEERK